MAEEVPLADWERRFRATVTFLPEWAPGAPTRIVYPSNVSGVWQLHAWDLTTDGHHQVTDSAVGVLDGTTTLDGEGIIWFDDETGDESGRWLVQPFHGGETKPFLKGVPHGWNDGLAQAPGIVAAAISDRDGFSVYVSRNGGRARRLYRSTVLGPARRRRGRWLRPWRALRGRLAALPPARRARRPHPPGAPRRRPAHERHRRRAARRGDVAPGTLLVARRRRPAPRVRPRARRRRAARHLEPRDGGAHRPRARRRGRCLRQRLVAGRVGAPAQEHLRGPRPALPLRARVGRARADPERAGVRLEGARAPRRRRLVPARAGAPAAACRRRRRRGAARTGGRARSARTAVRVLALREPARPARPRVPRHAGRLRRAVPGADVRPRRADLDGLRPLAARGAGVRRRRLRGRDGQLPRLDRVRARVARHADREHRRAGARGRERGPRRPRRARHRRPGARGVGGHSWGGYVTLLELGKHPELWRCGVAGVPVGDYEDGYEELSPLLQAYDRALLGGKEPKDLPELMRDRNAINFADDVRAPVLFLIGRNDSRCPYRQAMRYVERLAARGTRTRCTSSRPATARSTSTSASARWRRPSSSSPSTCLA